MTELNKKPEYMDVSFNKIYNKKRLCSVLDDPRISAVLTLGAEGKIVKDILREITKNAHVLQIGVTFGSEISAVYEKVCKKGKFDIFDVSEEQVAWARERYSHHNINIINYNALLPWDEKYDVIICYNLLHELPLKSRCQVMDNALSSLTNGGKAIFVDYAEPKWWNPLKWPLFLFNILYKPFAESMWQEPLENFCSLKEKFRWSHQYYRGRIYQKTVAVGKILSSEDVLKLTKLFKEK